MGEFVPHTYHLFDDDAAVLSATDPVALFLLRPGFSELWRTRRVSRGPRFARPKDLGYDV